MTELPKIYTKTGDKGTSSLYNGERREKTHPIFEALGDIDELGSFLGLSVEFATENEKILVDRIRTVQNILFDVCAAIATPRDTSKERTIKKTAFSNTHVKQLEEWIDEMNNEFERKPCFVLVSGGKFATHLHVCRTICRRAERHMASLLDSSLDEIVYSYINRLSDFLYTAGNWASWKEGIEPVPWTQCKH
ncbi:hypothetical protein WA158_002750 [Blastocystis sp. Blastoise]